MESEIELYRKLEISQNASYFSDWSALFINKIYVNTKLENLEKISIF